MAGPVTRAVAGPALLPFDLPADLLDLINGCSIEPDLAGEAGATVLRLTASDGEECYLKYGVGHVADDVADEAHRLAWMHERLPCAEPIHFTRTAEAAWLLTGAVAGRTGDAWIEADPARLPMVVDAFAGFLRRLHALPADECPFEAGAALRMAAARRNVEAGLVDLDDLDDDHAGWSAEQLWDELVRLRPAAGRRVVTHGDFSLGNLLIDEGGVVTGCIDVGRLGVADPYQDLAILWQNLRELDTEEAARFLTVYGLDEVDQERLEFHRCLDEFF